MSVRTYPSAAEFLAATEDTLLRDEAKNNLILGIADRVCTGGSYGDDPPYFLSIDAEGRIAAAAIRTPPYPLILHCDADRTGALDAMVEHVFAVDPSLPGVNGESWASAAFARLWAERSTTRAEIETRLRVYRLREVDPLTGVPGHVRLASDEDADLLAEWIKDFRVEAVPGDPPTDPRDVVLRFMESGTLAVWDDGGPVSVAGSSRGSRNGATVSAVYTPPQHRGNGYASACVAALSQRLLDAGNAFCTLYADLANPTSNKIYQRIGFRPICDSAMYRFVPRRLGGD